MRVTRWRWIAALIGIGVGGFVAYELWPYIEAAGTAAEPVKHAPVPPPPGPPASPTVVQSDPKLAAVGTDSSVSSSPLTLVLVSTLPGRNAREGKAMLGVDPRNAQTYMAGAILENGARLSEIYSDHVVLVKDERRATLYLQDSPRRAESSAPDSLMMVGGQQEKVAARRLSHDPITDYVRAMPVYQGESIVGIQIFPGAQSSIFRAWGLQSGDVVTSLNGSPLVDADQTIQLLHTLAEGATLIATVQRNERSMHVSLDGNDITRYEADRSRSQLAQQGSQ